MHGTVQATPFSSAPVEAMVTDPVCGMTVDPAKAAAKTTHNGRPVYFCSEGCHRRFLADPDAFGGSTAAPVARSGHECCTSPADSEAHRPGLRAAGVAAAAGLTASAIMLGFYFGILSLVSGWQFTIDQFVEWWPYIVALAAGFGIQVGLFTYLRRAVHGAASGKVMAATGTTSGAAMVSCCTHYLVNVLPVLGATGLVSFVGQYQVELFWFGIASNLAGIAYIGRRVASYAHGA